MKKYIIPEPSTSSGAHDSNSIRVVGRLHTEEAAELLGFQSFDIPVLVRHKLLRPLGNPEQNSVKYFAAVQILSVARDPDWLDKATRTISRYWKLKNGLRKTKNSQHSPNPNIRKPS